MTALTAHCADSLSLRSDYSCLNRQEKIVILQAFIDLDGCRVELSATDSLVNLQANHLAFKDTVIKSKDEVISLLENGNAEQLAATNAANDLYTQEKKKGRRNVIKAATAGTLTSVAALAIGFVIGIFYHH